MSRYDDDDAYDAWKDGDFRHPITGRTWAEDRADGAAWRTLKARQAAEQRAARDAAEA